MNKNSDPVQKKISLGVAGEYIAPNLFSPKLLEMSETSRTRKLVGCKLI